MSKKSSRVRITEFQRNTTKYSGNPFNFNALVNCRGRSGVMCTQIKSRAEPRIPVASEPEAGGGGGGGQTITLIDNLPDGSNGTPSSIGLDSNGHIYVTYADVDSNLIIRKSTDNGGTWENPMGGEDDISPNAQSPSMFIDNNNYIYLTYYSPLFTGDNKLYFTKSEDGGGSWNPLREINNTSTIDGLRYKPFISVDASNVEIMWEDTINRRIWTSASQAPDYPLQWSADRMYLEQTGNEPNYASRAQNGSVIYIVYAQNDNDPEYGLYFFKNVGDEHIGKKTEWDPNGGNPPFPRPPGTAISTEYPASGELNGTSVAVSGDNVYAFHSSVNGIFMHKSTNGGAEVESGDMTWEEAVTVFGEGTGSDFASIADGDKIFVSYYNITDENLQLAKSSDGGATWEIEPIDLAHHAGQQSSIKLVGTTLYISYLAANENNKIKVAIITNV